MILFNYIISLYDARCVHARRDLCVFTFLVTVAHAFDVRLYYIIACSFAIMFKKKITWLINTYRAKDRQLCKPADSIGYIILCKQLTLPRCMHFSYNYLRRRVKVIFSHLFITVYYWLKAKICILSSMFVWQFVYHYYYYHYYYHHYHHQYYYHYYYYYYYYYRYHYYYRYIIIFIVIIIIFIFNFLGPSLLAKLRKQLNGFSWNFQDMSGTTK